MIQKFSQQEREPRLLPADQPPSRLSTPAPDRSSHNYLLTEPRPAPSVPFGNSTILREEHLRKQNGSLAAAIPFLPCSPSPSPLLCLSLFPSILSHSFLSPLLLLPSRAAAAFGAADENIKEARNFFFKKRKKKKKRERERAEPTWGRLEKLA